MSFLKGILGGDPAKSAAKHEKRARVHQAEGNEDKAADEWSAAGRDYQKIPDYKRASEAFLQAGQFYFAVGDNKREEAILSAAVDTAIAAGDFVTAAGALTQIIRIGTRLKDNEILLHSYSLQTIVLIAGNDLAKAKQTHREAEKVVKRLGRKKKSLSLYSVATAFINRLVEGEPVVPDLVLPTRFDEPEYVTQVLTDLSTLYNDLKDSELKLRLDNEDVKLKERVSGSCEFSFSTPVKILETQIVLPSNIALLEDLEVPTEMKKKSKLSFIIEPRLPGTYDVGPVYVLFQRDNQNFQMKSNKVELRIAAAKPRIEIIAETPTKLYSQEEFELLLRVENNSHGDAADVTLSITLPYDLLLRTGTLEKRIITLPAQQHVQFPLFLIARKIGKHEGKVECVYAGPRGRRTKIENTFTVQIHPRVQKEKD
ncbi:MAG: hypothetical protein ACFFD8_07205 [Candidatus Thorarchaeota archaeon]